MIAMDVARSATTYCHEPVILSKKLCTVKSILRKGGKASHCGWRLTIRNQLLLSGLSMSVDTTLADTAGWWSPQAQR